MLIERLKTVLLCIAAVFIVWQSNHVQKDANNKSIPYIEQRIVQLEQRVNSIEQENYKQYEWLADLDHQQAWWAKTLDWSEAQRAGIIPE
jgi:type VI protein secretion system component VasK